jgi:hypothetical protein
MTIIKAILLSVAVTALKSMPPSPETPPNIRCMCNLMSIAMGMLRAAGR